MSLSEGGRSIGVVVEKKRKVSRAPRVLPTFTVSSDNFIHFEGVDGNEHPGAAYTRALMFCVRNFRIRQSQRKGYMLDWDPDDATYDISKDELQSILWNLRGNNIRPILVKPSIRWYPAFNHVILPNIHFHRAYLYALSFDPIVDMMYSSKEAGCKSWMRSNRALLDPQEFNFLRPAGVPSLKYLCSRVLLDHNKNIDPVHIMKESFVSGGSARGMLEAVSKMSRDNIKPNESATRIATAFMRMMAKHQANKKTESLPMDDHTISRVSFENNRSGGINPHVRCEQDRFDDFLVDYVSSFTKEEGGMATRILAIETIDKLRKEISRQGFVYSSDLFDPIRIVHKMSLKPESRPPGTDPYKTRIIFIVSAIKTLLDRAIYSPIMSRLYNIGANGIGTKWLDGGATRFARTMGAYDYDMLKSPRAWLSLDISKFDQSVLASLLMLVLFYPWLLYSRQSKDWKIVENLILYSIENSVAKVVKWFGDEWRLVWGLMFSGELMTSFGDSLYLEVIFECFDMYLYDRLGRDPTFKTCFRRFKDYGDDGSLGYSLSVMRSICRGACTPVLLSEYLDSAWHMTLKLEDTYVCFDDDARPDPSLSCFFTQLGSTPYDEIKYRGPKFLKRYIIRDVEPLPWRPTVDYFSKSACIAGNNMSVPNHIVRLRALALDTFGTNLRAYNFLERAHDYLSRSFCNKGTAEAVVNVLHDMARGVNSSVEDRNLYERVGGRAGVRLIRQGFPRHRDIYARTLYKPGAYNEVTRNLKARHDRSAQSLAFDTAADL